MSDDAAKRQTPNEVLQTLAEMPMDDDAPLRWMDELVIANKGWRDAMKDYSRANARMWGVIGLAVGVVLGRVLVGVVR